MARSRSILAACLVPLALVLLALPAAAVAADWEVLFDGHDLAAWQNPGGDKPSAGWVVEDGALVRKEGAGGIWSKKRYGDFALEFEFKTEGNSGVFFRTDKPQDPVQTGIEMQVDKPAASPGKHSTGALYDLLAPGKVADKAGQWNRAVIRAEGPRITIELNGEKIIDADLDRWMDAEKNPDGTKNKFRTALKDFKREGHIGLQDHGHAVAYRNLRVMPLP